MEADYISLLFDEQLGELIDMDYGRRKDNSQKLLGIRDTFKSTRGKMWIENTLSASRFNEYERTLVFFLEGIKQDYLETR